MKLKEIKNKYQHHFKDVQGRIQGEYLNYWINGNLDTKCFFKDGKKDGEYLSYHYNGQLCTKRYFKDGKYDGEYLRYYKNGKLDIKRYYKDGKEITEEEWLLKGDIKNKLMDILE